MWALAARLAAVAPDSCGVVDVGPEERRIFSAADRERGAEEVGDPPHRGRRSPVGGGARRRLGLPAVRAGKALHKDQLLEAVADANRQGIGNGLQGLDLVGIGVGLQPAHAEKQTRFPCLHVCRTGGWVRRGAALAVLWLELLLRDDHLVLGHLRNPSVLADDHKLDKAFARREA